jgi:hypothetical protein
MLTDIETYCYTGGLKVNTSKTKTIIFEKGRHTQHIFYIYNTPIELVDLGITLFKMAIGLELKTQ